MLPNASDLTFGESNLDHHHMSTALLPELKKPKTKDLTAVDSPGEMTSMPAILIKVFIPSHFPWEKQMSSNISPLQISYLLS